MAVLTAGLKTRLMCEEEMDSPDLPESVHYDSHRSLSFIHWFLGNTRAILQALQTQSAPPRRVLDIGCGRGDVLRQVRLRTGASIVGVDLRLPRFGAPDVPMLRADATRDPLPRADVAISVCVIHHLTDDELVQLIRNVARSSERLVLLDLVRHWLPLLLFRVFMYPVLYHLTAADGVRSIRRAYTPDELRRVIERALEGTGGSFRHSVNPFFTRQIVDISFPASDRNDVPAS